jgi:transposase
MDEEGNALFQDECASSVEYLVKYVQWRVLGEAEVYAAIESCGGASQLADDLRQRGWHIELAHAGYVSNLRQRPDKSDKQDAELLADLVRVGYLPRVWLAPERIRQLRSLVRFRQQLAQRRRQAKMRIGGLLRESGVRLAGRPWSVAWQTQLEQHKDQLGSSRSWICGEHLAEIRDVEQKIEGVEQRLSEAIANDPTGQRLLTQKGVGLVTATTLLAEVGDFERFARGKQLARYCGTAPLNYSTGGNNRVGGLGSQCNHELRRVIIEAAHRLTRYVPRWRQLKSNLRASGKSGAEATAAVANRWIRWLHHEMTRSEMHPQAVA